MRCLPIVLALLVSLPLAAQPVLHGRLLTPDGEPRADERVLLESGRVGPSIVDSTRTDSDGRFVLALPGAVTFGLGIGSRFADFFPLLASEAADVDRIDLEIRLGDLASPDGFAATSSLPLIADVMAVYARAERHHRTPVTLPALERFMAEAEETMDAAPLTEKESLSDSLGQVRRSLYNEIALPRVERFLAPLAEEMRPLVRQAYALTALDKVHTDSARAALVLQTVPANSPLWSYEGLSQVGVGNLIARMAMGLDYWSPPGPSESFETYLDSLATAYPDPNVQVQALGRVFEMAVAFDGVESARVAYDRLTRDFPDSRATESARRSWDETRALRPGQPLPSFAFRSLADTTDQVTTADVDGRTFLLDFWGTWCVPCIAEMPGLHALYDEYRDRGFEIVSVAVFDTPGTVAAFRDRGYPMPWRHGFVEDGDWETREAIQERFEFTGYPSARLVGPGGTILAEGMGARGDELAAALAAHLAGAAED